MIGSIMRRRPGAALPEQQEPVVGDAKRLSQGLIAGAGADQRRNIADHVELAWSFESVCDNSCAIESQTVITASARDITRRSTAR